MAFFGPRLDRPSAVGAEGRPRATSLTIASIVVVGLFVLAGWQLGEPGLLLSVGTFVGFTVAGAALQSRERLAHRFVGHLCFLPAGTIVVLLLLLLSQFTVGITIGGFVVALIAMGLTWADVGDREGLQEATIGAGLTYVSLFVWIVAASVVGIAYGLVLVLVTDSTLVGTPLLSFVVFAAILAATAIAVWLALASLPILQLTPRDDRDRVRARLRGAKRATTWIAAVASVTVVLGLVAEGYDSGGVPGGGAGPVEGVLLAVGSPVVLGALVVLGTIALVATTLARGLRLLTTHLDANTSRLVAAMAASGLVFALVGMLALTTPGLVGTGLVPVALLLPIALLFVLGGLLVLAKFGVLPDRAGGPAVAATGLFTAALGAGLAGLSAPVVFAIVAGALLVWDVSTYGLGVTAELGHLPETRRLELFHGVLAVGVGVVAVAALWGVVLGRRTFRVTLDEPIAATVIVVGVLLLAGVLRG